jgi:hypothetical protein
MSGGPNPHSLISNPMDNPSLCSLLGEVSFWNPDLLLGLALLVLAYVLIRPLGRRRSWSRASRRR